MIICLKILVLFFSVCSSLSFAQAEQDTETQVENRERAKELSKEGYDLNQQSEYEAAIEKLKEAIYADDLYAPSYYNLGFAYEKLEKYNKALESYRRYLRLKPLDHDSYIKTGLMYKKFEKYEKAIEVFTLGINECAQYKGEGDSFSGSDLQDKKMVKGYAFLLWNRAEVYLELKKYEEALTDYKKFQTAYPKDKETKERIMICIENILTNTK